MSADVLVAVEGPVRAFALAAPFPVGPETPHDLVAPHETALYRFYDDYGDLLYVGISWSPWKRWTAHRATSAWWSEAVTVQVDVYPTAREALAIEREWIANAAPRFNVRSRC